MCSGLSVFFSCIAGLEIMCKSSKGKFWNLLCTAMNLILINKLYFNLVYFVVFKGNYRKKWLKKVSLKNDVSAQMLTVM